MNRPLALFMILALLLLSGPATAAAGPADQPPDPATRFYVDLVIDSGQEAAALARLIPDWDEALEAGASQVILTQAEIDRLLALGYRLQVLGEAPELPLAWPACYNKLSDLYTWLFSYAATHDDLVELIDYGDSWCKIQGGCFTTGGNYIDGSDLWVARITNRHAAGPKEGRFFVDGGLHAREIPGPEVAKAFIESLVDSYGSDPDATWLLDQREIYVVLSSNPDGRRLVELGTEIPYAGSPWYWRKNGNNSIAGSSACAWQPTPYSQYGIDLNRNHVFQWSAPGGYSTYVCDQTYRGPSPGSEPEIDAYENFVRSIIPDQRGPGDNDPAPPNTTGFLINLHNYVSGGVVLVPWGWTTANAPNNNELTAIANKLASFNGYGVQRSLYPVSGNTRDWAYGELGMPAYVIEMNGNDFFTSCSLLPGVVSGMLPLLRHAARIADQPYLRVYGPDARSVAVSQSVLASGIPFVLTAQINDTQNGNQAIAGAEYAIVRQGGPPPGAPGSGIAMAAADGTFNASAENVTATVSTVGLGRGRYLAMVRGRDVGGNWGPFSAQLVEVTCFYADMNCDGAVDVFDVQMTAEGVQRYWNTGAYDYIYDVDLLGSGDGDLDIVDIAIVAGLFNPAPGP